MTQKQVIYVVGNYVENIQSTYWLRDKLKEHINGKTVVISHHAPSFRSNHAGYGMNQFSYRFLSNLGELV